MRSRILMLSAAALVALPGLCSADTVQVRVSNESGADVFVRVTDLNQAGSPVITNPEQQRLNFTQDTMVPAQLDGNDRYHLHWYVSKPTTRLKRKTMTAKDLRRIRVG
jgi:hypothetical protein